MNEERWQYFLEFEKYGIKHLNYSKLKEETIFQIFQEHIEPKAQRLRFKDKIYTEETGSVPEKPRVKRIKVVKSNIILAYSNVVSKSKVNSDVMSCNTKEVPEIINISSNKRKLIDKKVNFNEAVETFSYEAQPKFQKKSVTWP